LTAIVPATGVVPCVSRTLDDVAVEALIGDENTTCTVEPIVTLGWLAFGVDDAIVSVGVPGITVTAAVPFFPPALAVIVTVPPATPVTTPAWVTVAEVAGALVQLTRGSGSQFDAAMLACSVVD
jgi:hypothetical protein